ncbi:MAG TPA: VWA domain-containing protein, partial [Candidatus Gracilibacteria bacterium]|nr:VWA domain-containing protein [Candidatus Gracilibacteria bacterium]
MKNPPLSRIVLLIILLLSAVFFAVYQKPLTIEESGFQLPPVTHTQQQVNPKNLVDDWQFNQQSAEYDKYGGASYGQVAPGRVSTATGGVAPKMAMMEAAAPAPGNIGFSVGGAKDINNFRENIANDFLPLPTDVTYEGLFYDYFFDTGASQACDKLFCPSYGYAVTKDPVSEKDEYYLSVGLNSGIKETDFQRKKLNLLVVLDISGSMGSPFDEYYYDQFGNRQLIVDSASGASAAEKEEASKKKIEVASQSIVALLDHLNADDRFGMVVYDDYAELAKPLNLVGSTDMLKIKNHILELQERGSTNLSAGMEMASKQFREF